MYRPLLTALGVVVLAGTLQNAASAATSSTGEPAAMRPIIALESTAVATSATQPYAISPNVRAELAAAQTASNMPSADADLEMWTGHGRRIEAASRRTATGIAKSVSADAIHRFASGIISRTSSLAMSLTRSAMRFIGTPYVFGGTSASGFDCSGYTQHVFAMLGISLPRTADAQYYAGRPTTGGIAAGDLVFFQTYLPGPSHVGIYLGGGRFIHSSGHGVRISALRESYWAARYLGAKRVASF